MIDIQNLNQWQIYLVHVYIHVWTVCKYVTLYLVLPLTFFSFLPSSPLSLSLSLSLSSPSPLLSLPPSSFSLPPPPITYYKYIMKASLLCLFIYMFKARVSLSLSIYRFKCKSNMLPPPSACSLHLVHFLLPPVVSVVHCSVSVAERIDHSPQKYQSLLHSSQ